MKSFNFWDLTPSSLVKVNWHFGGTVTSIFMVRHQAKQETSILALFFSPKDEGVIFL
jgi:hypothetical protein